MASTDLSRKGAVFRLKKPAWLNSALSDKLGNGFVLSMAGIVIALLVLIYLFVGVNSYQTFTQSHISLGTFLTSKDWAYSYGTLVLMVGSLSLMVIGLAIAVPLSVGIALFIAEIAPPWLARILRGVVELFLGIPSVIFGLLGLLVIVPFVAYVLNNIAGDAYFTTGFGIFAAGIVVAFMVVPTITTIAIDSIRAIPRELREGSLALGATRWQTITKTIIPAAVPGIMTGVILGAARILGETIAVGLVIGGSSQIFGIDHYKNGKLFIGSTAVLTTQIFHDFADAGVGTDIYNAIWTLAFFLLLTSALFVFVSRLITARRIYQ